MTSRPFGTSLCESSREHANAMGKEKGTGRRSSRCPDNRALGAIFPCARPSRVPGSKPTASTETNPFSETGRTLAANDRPDAGRSGACRDAQPSAPDVHAWPACASHDSGRNELPHRLRLYTMFNPRQWYRQSPAQQTQRRPSQGTQAVALSDWPSWIHAHAVRSVNHLWLSPGRSARRRQ